MGTMPHSLDNINTLKCTLIYFMWTLFKGVIDIFYLQDGNLCTDQIWAYLVCYGNDLVYIYVVDIMIITY